MCIFLKKSIGSKNLREPQKGYKNFKRILKKEFNLQKYYKKYYEMIIQQSEAKLWRNRIETSQ